MRYSARHMSQADDTGAVLVLAMVFLLAIGLVGVATAGLAVGANTNTFNARAQQVTQANVESEVSIAIQDARVHYDFQGCSEGSCYGQTGSTSGTVFSSPDDCTPPTSSGGISGLEVVCEGSGGSHYGLPTRTVDFWVCSKSVAIASCPTTSDPTLVALYAEMVYQDLPGGENQSNDQCSSTSTATCGIIASVSAWDVKLADR